MRTMKQVKQDEIRHLQRLCSENHARQIKELNSNNPFKHAAVAQLDRESGLFKAQIAKLLY
jgi:hypothetical protein